MPHPTGMIQFNLKKIGTSGIQGEIILPEGLTGSFQWNEKTISMKGVTKIDIQ
jgi:hypothetical protein